MQANRHKGKASKQDSWMQERQTDSQPSSERRRRRRRRKTWRQGALPGCSSVKLQALARGGDDKACMFTLAGNRVLPVNYSTMAVFINTVVVFSKPNLAASPEKLKSCPGDAVTVQPWPTFSAVGVGPGGEGRNG